VDRIFHGEPRPYRVVLIRCQSDHGEYVCPYGGVVMSGGDEMGSSTQVPLARRAWVLAVTSCPVCH
jgi:hypothetical protein